MAHPSSAGNGRISSLQDPRVPIVAISPSGNVTRVNAAARRLLGVPEDDKEGANLGLLLARYLTGDGRRGSRAALLLSGLEEGGSEINLVLSDEWPIPLAKVPPPVADATEAQPVVRREDLRLADYIAHELRNPIGTILGLSQILGARFESISGEDRSLALESVHGEAEKALLILEGLLRLARMRTKPEDETANVPLHAVLRRVVSEHRKRNPERRLLLRGDNPMFVQANSVWLELAMANLLSNAEKYTPRGNQIEIEFSQDGNRAMIMVIDHGVTLPAERYRLLWEIYSRGAAPEIVVSGSGIGLALCKELIEGMGGRVWAGPSPKGGSIFTLTLPTPFDRTVPEALSTAICNGEPLVELGSMPLTSWN